MESRPKILIVDDEPDIHTTLKPFLERAGFFVTSAVDGQDALRKVASFEPDLIVLDILMPKIDGREVLRRLRQAGNWVHVIMLTQVTGTDERITALDEGADDYLNKPFEAGELAARIRAVLRRVRPLRSTMIAARKLRCGSLLLDRQARRAHLGGKELPLRPKEFAVLEYLMLHPGALVERDDLLDAIWGQDYATSSETVYVRIHRLRQVLGDDAAAPRLIETVPGQGYRFIGTVEVAP